MVAVKSFEGAGSVCVCMGSPRKYPNLPMSHNQGIYRKRKSYRGPVI